MTERQLVFGVMLFGIVLVLAYLFGYFQGYSKAARKGGKDLDEMAAFARQKLTEQHNWTMGKLKEFTK